MQFTGFILVYELRFVQNHNIIIYRERKPEFYKGF